MEYSQLEEKIRQVIRANGSGLITGTNLQEVMLDVLDFANTHGGGDGPKVVHEVTYQELVTLRNNSELVEGDYYRITDYACTLNNSEGFYQNNFSSAGHVFDIILKAASTNTLSEEATADHHEGDTYFEDCDLSKWKIWYCLDNDVNRFDWALDGSDGKGVIYRMIDEFNNDCPYDFKNILIARYKASESPLQELPSKYGSLLEDSFVLPYNFNQMGVTADSSQKVWLYTFSGVLPSEDQNEYPRVLANDTIIDLSVSIHKDLSMNLFPEFIKSIFGNNHIDFRYYGDTSQGPLLIPGVVFIDYVNNVSETDTPVYVLSNPLINSMVKGTNLTIFSTLLSDIDSSFEDVFKPEYTINLGNGRESVFYTSGLMECRVNNGSIICGNSSCFDRLQNSFISVEYVKGGYLGNSSWENTVFKSTFEDYVTGIRLNLNSNPELSLKVLSGKYDRINNGQVDLTSYRAPLGGPSLYIGISPTNNKIKAWIPGDNTGISADYNGVNSGGGVA